MLYTNPPRPEKKLLYKRRFEACSYMIYGSTGKFIGYLESIISGERRGLFSTILKSCLLLISWMCVLTAKLRRLFYSKGVLRTKHLPCKVISVGNIVVGGSGKTPAVIAIARMLKQYTGLKTAVLSRGYRSKARGPAVVSDGGNVLLGLAEAGDEPYLLGGSLVGIPVLIGKDRIQTGLMAIRRWRCHVIILDDGFQYLRLARDVDIVTVDATRPFGLDHNLPRGYLREPLSTLNHADLILLTRVDQCESLDSVRGRLSEIAPSVPIFESIHKPLSLRSSDNQHDMGLDAIRGKSILAVCGIANPMSFVETLRSLGPAQVNLLSFPDHHAYPLPSIERIKHRAAESDVDIIVTTEKDAPKLASVVECPVLILTVELELVDSSAGMFLDFIQQRCKLSGK